MDEADHATEAPWRSAQRLLDPATHALSLSLAAEAITGAAALLRSPCVEGVRVKGPGLVEVVLRAGSTEGYGARSWPLRIGGAGLGDEPALAAVLGTPARSPVAVRFDVPFFAMPGVDSTGFVDSSFFDGLGAAPTLQEICDEAARWLRGDHFRDPRQDDEGPSPAERETAWRDAERHTLAKVRCIDAYRRVAKCPALVDESAALEAVWLAPALRPLITAGPDERRRACLALLEAGSIVECAPVGSGIYAFDLFTAEFCSLLLAEVDSFEATDLPRRRPNTMNKAGLIVDECGMRALAAAIVAAVMAPLAAAVYPSEAFAPFLDHHHAFVVHYSADESKGDTGLDMHHDASEVTLNVCLGRDFSGSGLRFCGRFGAGDHRMLQSVVQHKPGRALVHLGRHRHGADDIQTGERFNLIVWARSSAFRGAAAYGHVPPDGYPRRPEDGVDRLCLSKANDADYDTKLRAILNAPAD
ncbi:hypothetical protein M885DRAFT_475339 [Pelagophyceae sp. CCMP2097]|nr:hypothetical protein M885DRAFT_475339 [Pelagophyceae sp. CCMP2097]